MKLAQRVPVPRASRALALEVIAAIPIIGLVAACGASTAVPAAVTTSATATATTQVASAAPTPAPPPPVVMIEQQSGASGAVVLQAMDPSGTPLWSVPYSQAPTIVTSGPRIFEYDASNKVSVFDRTGHSVGNGVMGNNRWGAVVFSPTSAEWAWSSDDGVSPSPLPSSGSATHRGSFWVAGVREPAHKVYGWTETDSADSVLDAGDQLAGWSDQGLVSSELPPWTGCASGHQSSSFIVNPSTGARTDLGAAPAVDVHGGVIASAPRNAVPSAPQTVVLSGRTSFTWTEPAPPEHPDRVSVSPAGDLVAVSLINTACIGEAPRLRTAVINVADHSVQYVVNALAMGWLDDTHLIAQVTWYAQSAPNPELDIVGLDGTRTLLGHGQLLGVLTSS